MRTKHTGLLIIILEFIVLLFLGLWASQGETTHILTATDISQLQNISLEHGFYRVTVLYESSSGESGGSFVSSASPDRIISDTVQFYSWRTQSSASFWLLHDLDDICYVQSIHSELNYHQIDLYRTAADRRLIVALLALLFLILDGTYGAIRYIAKPLHMISDEVMARRQMTGHLITFLSLIGIIVLVAWPLFCGKLIRGDDLIFHMNRIDAIADTLRDGFFPVRLYSEYFEGAGYAQPIFYGELFLYPAALLRLLGLPLSLCFKAFMGMAIALSTVLAWIAFRALLSNRSTILLATLASQLSLYRLSNLYQRDSVGEYLAMMFLPMVFCGFYLMMHPHTLRKRFLSTPVLLLGIGMAGIVSSHVLTTVMTLIILIIWSLFYLTHIFRNGAWKDLLHSAILALSLSAYFWGPFLDYSLSGQYHFNSDLLAQSVSVVRYQITTSGLFALRFDPSLDVALIGLPTMLCVIVFIILVILVQHRVEVALDCGDAVPESYVSYRAGVSLTALTLLCILLTWQYFPWDGLIQTIPALGRFLNTLQFPFRFAAPATMFAAMEFGFSTELCKELFHSKADNSTNKIAPVAKQRYVNSIRHIFAQPHVIYGALISGLFVITASSSLYWCMFQGDRARLEDGFAYTEEFYGEGFYLPDGIYIRERFQDMSYTVSSGKVTVENFNKGLLSCTFSCENKTNQQQRITLPLIAYKGYVASPSDISINSTENDLVVAVVPAGFNGEISISFQEPWYWRISEVVSLVMMLLLILFL